MIGFENSEKVINFKIYKLSITGRMSLPQKDFLKIM